MTPSAVAWREQMIAKWSVRAGELRLVADALSQNKAAGLEWVIAGLREDLGDVDAPIAAPAQAADDVPSADIERLRRILTSSMPYRCPKLGIMINDGPIMDAVRARLQVRVDGAAFVPSISLVETTPTIDVAPPAEVVPFRMGPQISLFGEAA